MRSACFILAALACISTAAAEPPAHPALAQWAEAWSRNDAAALAGLYAPCARVWMPDARVQADGAPGIAYALAQDSEDHAARSLTFGQHSWREHGVVAVASGVALVHLVDEDGSRTPMALRFSMVWHGQDGGWRIIDQHLSLLAFDDE
jgi:ketosteroid isomerase-like protein